MSDQHLNRRVTKLEEKVAHLEHLDAPRQQDQAGISPQEASSEKGDATSGELLSGPHVPPAPGNTNQPKQPWYKSLERWKTITELVAIPFAVAYAIVTWCQWRDIRNNFMIDQRAWVGYKDLVRPDFKVDQPVDVTVILTNYGKTPAKKMRLLYTMKTLRPEEIFVATYGPDRKHSGLGAVLYPGQRVHVTTQSTVPMTELRIDALKNGRQLLYVYGKMSYEDIFGKPHFSTFCLCFERDLVDPKSCDPYNDAN